MKDATLQRCLADAFAAYILGPAYAFAAITLLLDPTRAEDDLRVAAILAMLERMDQAAADAFSESYPSLAQELLAAWRAARQQAGATFAPLDATAMAAAVAALFKELKTFKYSYFGVAQWKAMKAWAAELLKNAAKQIEIKPEHDLRHALNAAWLARIDAARTVDISGRAEELADRVKAELARRRSSDQAQGPLRGLG